MEGSDRYEASPTPPHASESDSEESAVSEDSVGSVEGQNVPVTNMAEKQRDLARRGEGSPVNQQPKKAAVLARTRLVVPNKGYASLEQSSDEKPLVAIDSDSEDELGLSRYSSSGYSSAEQQINQDLNRQLLKDGYRLDEVPDDEDLDLIPPKPMNPTCICCQLASPSTTCAVQ
uniref:Family with sequence similarity 219 member Aa n=1 Tax=Eptatretus burgeri TaxID=7764 RepID=A0A8C4QQY2_EPTBU